MTKAHQSAVLDTPSAATIPIPAPLVEALRIWRDETPYRAGEDWFFASPATSGRSPSDLRIGSTRHSRARSVRQRSGRTSRSISLWHTFRRSLATLLTAKGEGVKVVQELMRHANSKITLDIDAQGDEITKRAAQDHVSSLFVANRAK
jgi:integrase